MKHKTKELKKMAQEINRNTKLGSLENQIAIQVLDIFNYYENLMPQTKACQKART